MINLDKFFQEVGLSSDRIQGLRLGKGIVGKLANIGIVAIIVLGAIALKFSDWRLLLVSFTAIFALAFFLLRKIIKMATDRPDIAILEGAEFLIYHQKFPLGAKGKVIDVQTSDSLPDPEKPKLPPAGEDDKEEKEERE